MAAVSAEHMIQLSPQMKGPLLSSLVFHVFLFVIAITGVPYLKSEIPIIEDSIAVELIAMDELAEDKNEPERRETKRQPPENKTKPPERRVMPQVTSKKPPKPVAPAPPEDVVSLEPPEKDVPAPIKKPEPIKVKTPPKPLKRPVLTQTNEEEQQEEFKSLLKNLMPTEQEQIEQEKGKSQEKPSPLTRFSQRMNVGELGALKAQLNQCWSVLAGARYAEDLIIELRLFVNRNRTIQDVKVVNQLRYNTDSFFRAAADSAKRAVYRCSPLDLPPEKFELWKTITVTFDPRKVL